MTSVTTTKMLVFTLLCLAFQVHLSTCQFGTYNNNNRICESQFQACMTRELSLRLRARMNGAVALTATQDLIANFDTNGDQCITAVEFNTVMVQRFFSTAYANYRFRTLLGGTGVNNAVCPGGLSVAALRAQPVTAAVTVATINSNMAQSLMNFCDQNTQLYQTNCDCIQLPNVCSTQPLQTTTACNVFRLRYKNTNNDLLCPFSYMNINEQKTTTCANLNTAPARLGLLLRLLCNRLLLPNQVG